MKKLILPLVIVVALIIAAMVFISKRAAHSTRLAELLPAETVAFFHLPDVGRTRERWTKTALYQIAHEPEVQAFLERPKTKLPARGEIQQRTEQMHRVDPREAFLAVTSISDGKIPKFVTGFSYKGKREEVTALLDELRKTVQRAWPAGKTDLVREGANEIETFTQADFTGVAALRDDWLLLSDDLALMKATLARFDGKTENALRDNANFREAVSRMPIDFDVLSFVQTKVIVERLLPFLAMANSSASPQQLEELKKVEALAATTKLEGENFRDTMFVYKPGEGKKPAMARSGLALSSTDTVIYYGSVLQPQAGLQMPNGKLDSLGALPWLQPYLAAFSAQGLSMADFSAAFGPEMGVLTDWPASSPIPAPLVAIEVRDKAIAQRFVNVLTQDNSGLAWARQVVEGVTYFQMPAMAALQFQITPTIALSDRFFLAGISFDSVKAAAARGGVTGGKLDAVAAYKKAADAVKAPASAFGYVDTRAVFERTYGTLRPFAIMAAAFAKGTTDYVDVNKLPATETISKHLGPMVYSQSGTEDGLLSESVGPVTMTQALIGFGMGAGVAAAPMMKQFGAPALSSGTNAAGPGIFVPPQLTAPPVSAPPADPASTP